MVSLVWLLALWPPAARLPIFMFTCSDASVAVWHCYYLVGEERAGCFSFRWFVKRALSVVVGSLILLVSLVGYILWSWTSSLLSLKYIWSRHANMCLQGICCMPPEWLGTIEYLNGEQKPFSYILYVMFQASLSQRLFFDILKWLRVKLNTVDSRYLDLAYLE